jgi:hypothetical protein
VTTKTRSSRPGCWKASYVAEASPFSKNTHQQTTANAAMSGTTSSGRNSPANGAVSRRVRSGSVMAYRSRSPSSGLVRLTSGWLPSARVSRPSGRSFSWTRVAMFAALTSRPVDAETAAATSAGSRRPSIACSVW